MNYYTFDEGKKELLLSANKAQVMMEWEKPYMEACIDKLEPSGDVLEIGLGLGIASRYLLTFPKVKSLTTIEKNADVIELYPKIPRKDEEVFNKHFGHKKHTIHNLDGLMYVYNTRRRYDFIFLDFYDRIDEETLPSIKDMVIGCRRILKEGGEVVGWLDPHTPEEFVREFEDIFIN